VVAADATPADVLMHGDEDLADVSSDDELMAIATANEEEERMHTPATDLWEAPSPQEEGMVTLQQQQQQRPQQQCDVSRRQEPQGYSGYGTMMLGSLSDEKDAARATSKAPGGDWKENFPMLCEAMNQKDHAWPLGVALLLTVLFGVACLVAAAEMSTHPGGGFGLATIALQASQLSPAHLAMTLAIAGFIPAVLSLLQLFMVQQNNMASMARRLWRKQGHRYFNDPMEQVV